MFFINLSRSWRSYRLAGPTSGFTSVSPFLGSTRVQGLALVLGGCLAVAADVNASAQPDQSLEEVVVTARKLKENLQDTPVAVSAFSAAAIERLGLVSTEDLSKVTPNLQFKSYAPLTGNNGAAQVFIRGIGQSDASGGVDPGVGIYLDGVYLGRSVGGVLPLRDIQSVQVLRGPQGTYFGRNTIGGAVLLTSNAPGDEFNGEFRAGVGSDNLQEWFAAVDLPINQNLAGRISYGGRQQQGYVERVFDGLDLGDENTYTVTGALHWQASEALKVVVRGDYTEEDENGSPYVFAAVNEGALFPISQSFAAGCPGITLETPFVPQDVNDPRCANDATWDLGEFTNGGNTPVSSYLRNQGYSLSAEWAPTDTLKIDYIAAERELGWFGARDADNTFLTILTTQYESEAEQTSHELQLTYTGEWLQGVSGIYWYDEHIEDFLLVPFGVLPLADRVLVDYQFAELGTESRAYYSNWSLDVSERWSLSAGVRITEEEKDISLLAATAGLIDLPLTGRFRVDEPEPPFFVDEGPHRLDFNATTFSSSIQYRHNDALSTYLSWAEGFKSGGFNQRYNAPLPDALPIPFESEQADSYELGFKASIDGRWRVNGALFRTDYKNIQLTYRLGIVPILFNAGKASIEGAELEVNYAGDRLVVDASFSYLNDSIDSVADIPQAEATLGPDSDLPFTPEFSAGIGAGYRFELAGLDVTPRINISFTDKQYFDAANTAEIAQNQGETLTDLSLRVAGQKGWQLTAGINNLTDETYPIAGNSSLSTGSGYAEVIFNRPRTFYLTGGYHF